MKTAIENMGKTAVIEQVVRIAHRMGIPTDLGIDIVCAACCNDIDHAPEKRSKKISSDLDAIEHWVVKFYNGYRGRPSAKIGSPVQTKPDPAVSAIIACAFPTMKRDDIVRIEFAHRLAMSAENLLGPFVEEYVFERLKSHGWALAWGETVKSVDLCSRDGKLLQIKNRSNTENSSSKTVRDGTNIMKWFRVDARTGAYLWDGLCDIANVKRGYLSEEDFRGYVKAALKSNPNALGVDEDNPWV